MTSILIEEGAYTRLAAQLRAIDDNLQFIVMKTDGLLYFDGQPITATAAKPAVAWLNVDVARANLTKPYVEAVLAVGSVQWLEHVSDEQYGVMN